MRITIATKNTGKVKEILFFFRHLGPVEWLSLADLKDFKEIEETGNTFFENAVIKAKAAAEALDSYSLADDSGLCVDHLGGRPGVRSSRYSGQDATDAKNRQKLLGELEGVDEKKRSAAFICSMVLADPEGKIIHSSKGICRGIIGFEEVGDKGFGYDSIFIPEGHFRTMAQLSEEEKNSISHRGKALENMKDYIDGLLKQ